MLEPQNSNTNTVTNVAPIPAAKVALITQKPPKPPRRTSGNFAKNW